MRQFIGIIIAMGMAGIADMFMGIELIGMVIAALIGLSWQSKRVRGGFQRGYITVMERIISIGSLRRKYMI